MVKIVNKTHGMLHLGNINVTIPKNGSIVLRDDEYKKYQMEFKRWEERKLIEIIENYQPDSNKGLQDKVKVNEGVNIKIEDETPQQKKRRKKKKAKEEKADASEAAGEAKKEESASVKGESVQKEENSADNTDTNS